MMTTVSTGRSTSNRRALTALGTVAAAATCVATVVLGARAISVTPPAGDISPYCEEPYQCVQPYANPLAPNGSDPLVSSRPAVWNAGLAPVPVSISQTGRDA